MGVRRDAEPSPLRTGLVHTGLSLLVFGGVAGLVGAGIQLVGDPADAGPRRTLALFETQDEADPALKARLKTDLVTTAALAVETPDYADFGGSGEMVDE